jgi:CRISPR-associated endonuclease Csn1
VESDDTENSQILQTGVRIVPIETRTADKFNKGQSVSPNKDRTTARTARKGKMRYRLRRTALSNLLKKMGIVEPQKPSGDIWQIRANAAQKTVSLNEFGQVLQHFNQKRGYKGGKNASEEETKSDYLKGIYDLEAKIAEANLTPAQYHLEQQQKKRDYRFKNGAGESKILQRKTYRAEFEKIWEQQAAAYPTILTNELKTQIADQTIFYQRKLKSQKSSISKCTHEKSYRTIPKSHPLYQDFVIWKTINDLVVTDKQSYEQYLPTDEQRQQLFEALSQTKAMKKKAILKELGFDAKLFELNFDEIKGNVTRAKLMEAFEAENLDTTPLKTPPPSIVAENDYISTLWHLIYATEPTLKLGNDEVIKNILLQKYKMTENQANTVSKISFPADFGSLSARAIRKLMPHLIEGQNEYKACQSVGYNHSEGSKTTEENEKRVLVEQLDLLKTNALRNPIVEKMLQHLINVVNDIIKDTTLGRPDEIRVELARELKSSAKQRQKVEERMKENKKENDKAIAAIEKEGKKATKKMIERYKLFKQTNGIDLYSGETMELADVLNENKYDIDHIIPQSKYFDDSLNNRIITVRHLNELKSNRTAFDFMKSRGDEKFQAYQLRLNELHKKISGFRGEHPKIKYLKMTESEIPQDFISRQLKETQYIAKEAKNILQKVVRNVHSTSGGVTDFLRNEWGLDVLLEKMVAQEGVYPDAEKMDRIFNKKSGHYVGIKDWNKRLDHRHHALDALIVACTKPAIINRLNKLSKYTENAAELKEKLTIGNSARKFPKPWANFVADVENILGGTFISFKKQDRVATLNKNKYKHHKEKNKQPQQIWTPRGAFHKETIYGKIKIIGEPIAVEKLKEKDLPNIAHQWQKDCLAQRLAQFDGNWKKAFAKLEENPIWTNKEKTKRLVHCQIFEERYVVRKDILALNREQVKDIVDAKIKAAVKSAWEEVAAKGKSKLDVETLQKYTHARRARWCDRATSLITIRENPIDGTPVGFVANDSNHHAAIYKNEAGVLNEKMVTFWEAFERKRQGVPVVQETHSEFGKLQVSMIIGEMFVFGMTKPELEEAIADKKWKKISKHLFRCQNVSSEYYVFRHHLATMINKDFQMVRVTNLKKMLTGIKVQITRIGRIEIVD